MKMIALITTATLGTLAMLLPAVAEARPGVVRNSGLLRAGPDNSFPAIRNLRKGQRVEVFGCLQRRSWCDIQVRSTRGWYPGNRLSLYTGRRYVRVTDPGVSGLVILSFVLQDYWGHHYNDRQWFYDRRWRQDDWNDQTRRRRDRSGSVITQPPKTGATEPSPIVIPTPPASVTDSGSVTGQPPVITRDKPRNHVGRKSFPNDAKCRPPAFCPQP